MGETTAQKMRSWRGPAILTYGFRPFFFGAGVWAALAMVLWILMLSGHIGLSSAFDPVSWHAHELLYGYLGAVVAGFMLTAVPNWTGRLPIVGWRLGGLAGLWLAGRVVVMVSASLPAGWVAFIDLSFPVVLSVAIGREIVAGRNWRNLVVLGMLAFFIAGNALFHWDNARGEFAANGVGFRLGLCAAIMMIAVIGGRIVPSFTRNWLIRHNPRLLPAPPMGRFDKVALLVLLAALILWVTRPVDSLSGIALVLAGALHLARLARWAGHRTLAEPLVTVLHVGYVFLPLGALAIGSEILGFAPFGMAAAQHLWMAGAIGLTTLAVMTRATLGHTGKPLTAGSGTIAIYLALIVAVMVRLASGVWPNEAGSLQIMSGVSWLAAFAGFTVFYGRTLLRNPPAKSAKQK